MPSCSRTKTIVALVVLLCVLVAWAVHWWRSPERLIHMLGKINEPVNEQVAQRLGGMGASAVPALIGALQDVTGQADHAAEVLTQIGEPALRPLLAFIATRKPLDDGYAQAVGVLIRMGEVGPSPQGASVLETVIAEVLAPRYPGLGSQSEALAYARQNYKALLRDGVPGCEVLLVAALRSGELWDLDMASAFLNCGNPALANEADRWAKGKPGVSIVPLPGGGAGSPRWGPR